MPDWSRNTNVWRPKLPERFKGLATIVAEKADLSGRRTTHYAISTLDNDGAKAASTYRLGITYDPQCAAFTILQTYPNKPYRNAFSMSASGEVIMYCDHVPNKTFVEALASGETLPRIALGFDLRFYSGDRPEQYVAENVAIAIDDLAKRAVLDSNLKPAHWQAPRLR